MNKKQLRDKFFKEHTYMCENGIPRVVTHPHNLFEWMYKQLTIPDVINCVYVVTERDNYGEQLFRQVFSNKEQAFEYLAEDGLKESNIDEINEIELK